MLRNGAKFVQRRLYSYINTWAGFTVFLILCYFLVAALIDSLSNSCSLRGLHSHCSLRHAADNIAFRDLEGELTYQPFDVVYTWVNGSDPRWKAKKEKYSNPKAEKKEESHENSTIVANNNHTSVDVSNSTAPAFNESSADADDTMSLNRYRDSEELRFSLRSLVKNAPWIRHIYIVTDNQVPYWLNLESTRLTVVSHEDIFPNKSHLPVFSSPAIEANLHRIPGLSKKFIYFNDDVFLGAKVLPEDFISMRGAQRLVMSWDVPKCAPGCSDTWIGDGFCDKACNVSACNFDFPDCINGTNSNAHSSHDSLPSSSLAMCNKGCPDNWLADKICDQRCKNAECGWDVGDCGLDMVYTNYPGVTIDTSNARIQSMSGIYAPGMEYGPSIGSYSYGGDPSHALFEDSLSLEQISEEFQFQQETSNNATESASAANTTISTQHSGDALNATASHSANATITSMESVPARANKNARTSTASALYPALTVEYGTYAVYFDLSHLGCLYSLNVTCVPEQLKEITYDKAEHDDEEGLVVHSTTVLTRHHVLVVLLYHGQDGALPFMKPSMDVKFTLAVSSSFSSDSTSAVFTMRVMAQGTMTSVYPIELVPPGMVLLSNQSYVRETADVAPHNEEFSLALRDLKILAHPYSVSSAASVDPHHQQQQQQKQLPEQLEQLEQGAIVSAELEIDTSTPLNEVLGKQILVRYTLTEKAGDIHSVTLNLVDAILLFTQAEPVSAFGPMVVPRDYLQSVLTAVEHSSKVFAEYVASQLPPRAARFLPKENSQDGDYAHEGPASIANSTISDVSNGTAVVAAAVTAVVVHALSAAPKKVHMHVKIPFPHGWQDQGSSKWYHIHADILYVAHDQVNNLPVCAHRWTENNECTYNATHLGGFTAAVKWGAEKPVTNESVIALSAANGTTDVEAIAHTNATDLVNTSANSTDYAHMEVLNKTHSPASDSRRRLSAHHAHTEHSLLHRVGAQISVFVSDLINSAVSVFDRLSGKGQEKHSRDRRRRRRLEDTYGQSLVHVNRLYTKTFGTEGRKVPAHVPHMIDKDYMTEMQERWPEQWNATSAHRFRSPTDMQYSFSYYYYLSNRIKVKPHDLTQHVKKVLDTDKDGYLNENEFRSLAAMVKGSQSPTVEYINGLLDCIANNSATFRRQHTEAVHHSTPRGTVVKSFQIQPNPSIAEALNCSDIENGLLQNVPWSTLYPSHVHESDKDIVAFEMIGDDYNSSLGQLDSVRQRQSKFVCINDNMKNPSKELEQALRNFYLSFFPEPCVFELPPGARNPTLYLDEYQKLMRQKSQLMYRAASTITGLPSTIARGMWRAVRAVLLPVVQLTADVLSEEDSAVTKAQASDLYVNGLRQDIARHPHYAHPATRNNENDNKWDAYSRNVLLISVVGVVGFALLRLVIGKNRPTNTF